MTLAELEAELREFGPNTAFHVVHRDGAFEARVTAPAHRPSWASATSKSLSDAVVVLLDALRGGPAFKAGVVVARDRPPSKPNTVG